VTGGHGRCHRHQPRPPRQGRAAPRVDNRCGRSSAVVDVPCPSGPAWEAEAAAEPELRGRGPAQAIPGLVVTVTNGSTTRRAVVVLTGGWLITTAGVTLAAGQLRR
jgi:hypothetical protein